MVQTRSVITGAYQSPAEILAHQTVSAIYSFFLAMTLFPHVQKRAQEEIDAVVGSDRLPSFGDRPNLPYVEALVQEVFRWNPVAPLGTLPAVCARPGNDRVLGVPHRLMEDDIYEGYLIPKGSIVIANIWQMLHDPSVYANPLEFDPTRYLPWGGGEAAPDPREICFGFGRRYAFEFYAGV